MRHEYPPDSTWMRAPQREREGRRGGRCWEGRRPGWPHEEGGKGARPHWRLPYTFNGWIPPHLHLPKRKLPLHGKPMDGVRGCKLPPHAHEHSPFSTFVTFSSSNVRALSRRRACSNNGRGTGPRRLDGLVCGASRRPGVGNIFQQLPS